MWPRDDFWPKHCDLHLDPREIRSHYQSFPCLLGDRWPQCWPLSWFIPKTNPIAKVPEFDLWMTFGQKIVISIMISRKPDPTTTTTKFWKFDFWMTFDPKMVSSIVTQRLNLSHHPSLNIWPLDDLLPPIGWTPSWFPEYSDPATKV